ncbi:MAG TPA: M14 family zinc carboxypeptidase [Candidatus Polarisedimenticolaceae bacterium]|nr:M14 family zinc carboxypeptidase [Candidatus Polarisedimenticolaceae bacterium]
MIPRPLLPVAAVVAVLLIAAVGVMGTADGRAVTYRLRVAVTPTDTDRLAALDLDVAGRDAAAGWVEVITGPDGLARLERAGFATSVIERRDGARPLAATEAGRAVGAGYTDPGELELFLQAVHADHPAITRLEVIGAGIEGRPIYAMLISDNAAADEDEPSLLFSGLHHAREVMTVEVMVDLIDRLTDGYDTDPAMKARVDAYQIWCVPLVNPDGLSYVFDVDDLWRKNLRQNDNSGRISWKDGVDINRNYVWAWGNQCLGSSGTISSDLYRGAYPGSEPETQALIALGRRIRPVFYVEYHSYGEDVFYAMGCDPVLSPVLSTIGGPDPSISRVIAEQYAARIVQADGEPGYSPAPYGSRVDGVGRDHHAHEHGTIAFVTELNSAEEGAFQPDYALWRDATVEGQRPGWTWLIDRVGGAAVAGHVVDAVDSSPLAAEIGLDQLDHPDGRRLTSDPSSGRFHLIVVPGQYTLRVRAGGYVDAEIPLEVGDGWQPIVVALERDGSSLLYRSTFEHPEEIAGWSFVSPDDDASAGVWEWDAPFGTHDGDHPSATLRIGAPSFDRTAGEGTRAFVTDNEPGAAIDDADVDGGATSLVSPEWDPNGRYGLTLRWQQWLRTDSADPLDGLAVELSNDGGQSWHPAGWWGDEPSPDGPSARWQEQSLLLDTIAELGPSIRVRFRAIDAGADHVVEAAIDEVELRGYSLAGQGGVSGLTWAGGRTRLEWSPVPGGGQAGYQVARGALDALAAAADEIALGVIDCFDTAPGETFLDDADSPAPGAGWFYVVRFRLGFSIGDWGSGTGGLPRIAEPDCAP